MKLLLLTTAFLMPLTGSAEILASFDFVDGSTASTDTSPRSTVSTYDPRSEAVGGDDSAVSSATGTAYMRAENTPNSSNPTSNTFHHTFSVTVAGLGPGETLDLTSLTFDYFATHISGTFFLGTYSDAVGYAGTGDKLATTNITTNAGDSFAIDLTASNAVAAQPDFIAGWNQLHKVQTCEVTGPGGIHGNPHPATDPIWTTGFDAQSVILRTLEDGTWHTWRLPKGSYSHDGWHGWHTEWPRIRQLDPGTANSPYLMHMHGLFLDFPATFSATDFSGLTPLCGYYKMPVDYCTFNGELVIAKNDASKFSNALARKAQSNMWWGQLSDLQDWGAPAGHGSVWMNQSVASDSGYHRIGGQVELEDVTNAAAEADLRADAALTQEFGSDNSGGKRKMRALATHGKRITDFASWRGLFVITGVLDDTPVTAGTPSDPFLMYGYDHKEVALSHTETTDVTFTIEVDFLADNTWSTYDTFTVASGETLTHTFPTGFHAHWVRVTSDTATTATAQFTDGPADQRDTFLDWARDGNLPTAAGRTAVATANGDGDELNDLAEFVFGTDPAARNQWPLSIDSNGLSVVLRDLDPADGITATIEFSADLQSWDPYPMVSPSPDQSGVPAGFTRHLITPLPLTEPEQFYRIAIRM